MHADCREQRGDADRGARHHQDGGRGISKTRTEKSGGTKLWSVSGHVNRPGVYELPMGYDDMEKFIMEDCGGILNGKQLKAVIPGGSSVYIMRADQIIGKDVRMDYEGLVAGGSMVARAASL